MEKKEIIEKLSENIYKLREVKGCDKEMMHEVVDELCTSLEGLISSLKEGRHVEKLKELSVWELYVENAIDNSELVNTERDVIMFVKKHADFSFYRLMLISFDWAKTQQGVPFWSEVSQM